MSDKEVAELIDLLYPHFIKKMKSDSAFKNCIKSSNAVVSWVDQNEESNIDKAISIRFPYDDTEISVLNRTGVNLLEGDLVCVHYYIDLKNAYVAYKV